MGGGVFSRRKSSFRQIVVAAEDCFFRAAGLPRYM